MRFADDRNGTTRFDPAVFCSIQEQLAASIYKLRVQRTLCDIGPPGGLKLRSYQKDGLTIAEGQDNDPVVVRELQRDLRSLGYLASIVDGKFGAHTAGAIRALRCDLLLNDGTGKDGSAGVSIVSFNNDNKGGKPVAGINGILDQGLASCLGALIGSNAITKLPSTNNPMMENGKAIEAIAATTSTVSPSPFIAALVIQESGGCHYHVPGAGDEDCFVTVGLDHNDPADPDRITSRGYGIGQYTIFHHPPRHDEAADFIADPVRNVRHAYQELRDKFDSFVAGPADRADDRAAEHPAEPLRLCAYSPSDQRYLRDCKNCALSARKLDIAPGTPLYSGTAQSYQPTQIYASAIYNSVPDRADFPCDWPYAVRRYNGSGINSYHYQTKVLLNLIR